MEPLPESCNSDDAGAYWQGGSEWPQIEAMPWTTSSWSSSRTALLTTCWATSTGPEDGKTFEGVIGKDLSNPIPEWAEHGAERKVVPYTRHHGYGLAQSRLG